MSDSRRMRTAAIAAAAGNIVEWYDWVVYALFAFYFAKQFFPAGSEAAALVATFGVFAVGFIARPIGSLTLGRITDRIGRTTAMAVTVVIMAAGSLLIGLAPTAATIGIWAAVLLTAARMLQGLALGAESSAVGAFLAESSIHGRRGLLVSIYSATVVVGTLIGSLVAVILSWFLSTEQLMDFGWRIPFIVGGALGVIAYFVRRSADETLDREQAPERRPLRALWRDHRSLVGATLVLAGSYSLVYFTMVVSFAPLAETTHADPQVAQWANTIGLIVLGVLGPLLGWLSDRVGRRPVLIAGFVGMIVLTIPGLLLMWSLPSPWQAILAQLIIVLPIAAMQGTVFVMLIERYPTRLRGMAFGFTWAVAMAAFGGTGPVIATWLAGHGVLYTMSLYIVVFSALAAVVGWRMKESAFSPLAP